jgi:hypothetical protein
MKKPVLIGIVLFVALIAFMLYSTLGMAGNKVEVCMQYDGRTSCRTASGSSKDYALRTAKSNACAEISSGVTDTIKCENSDPVRMTWK